MQFSKFEGNGNDFIIIDNIDGRLNLTSKEVQFLCDRRYGIGADGLILLNYFESSDFEMVYYNSDGNIGSMCGNGGRCIAAFTHMNNIAGENQSFIAFDGCHEAIILGKNNTNMEWDIKLKLSKVTGVEENDGNYLINTGSPHYVKFVKDISDIDVEEEGRKIRYNNMFSPDGTNVNFVELGSDNIFVRTYERGVEKETLSCGTGVTASAIASFLVHGISDTSVNTKGGDFNVSFIHSKEGGKDVFDEIWLRGPVKFVFSGDIKI
ncbi:MAG: diaminopimelate epimerase [Bacteroidales bacterium]|nr:diaminopimelate epimerase [Bacteroidales bacterium]MDG1900683.1 diaminopimelate epimerase [Bacteroidales bacterium]MDG2082047.1 diaminopimelate epimerase [Bacteroidales bacterium]